VQTNVRIGALPLLHVVDGTEIPRWLKPSRTPGERHRTRGEGRGAVVLDSPAMSAKITREDVAHVAALARLDVTDDELDRFTKQLDAILEHAASVESLEIEGVQPTYHPLPLINVFRDDVVRESLDRDSVLSQAPAAEDGRFRVSRILDSE